MKKVTLKNEPVIFKNNDFKSIQIKVFFPFKRDDQYAMLYLLPAMLRSMNMKYPTEEEFNLERQRLYIMATFCYYYSVGDTNCFVFNLCIPEASVLDTNIYEKQFSFFSEMIYNPKILNGGFYPDELEREISSLRVGIEKMKKDPFDYAMARGKELVDDIGLFSSGIYNHTEQIDKVNTNNLFEYYKEKIYNNQPTIYIMGNVEEEVMKSLCHKYIYRKKFDNKDIFVNTKNYFKVRENVINEIESSNFRNSIIAYLYKVKDMKEDDEIYLSTISDLLSSLSSRLLNKKLRDENDLVYSSFSTINNDFGILGIFASINKNNEDDVRGKITEVMDDLRNEDLISPMLENIKERHRISLIRLLDNKNSLFIENIINDLGVELTSREQYMRLLEVTAHDISLFVDRLVLDTTYFLKEADHE